MPEKARRTPFEILLDIERNYQECSKGLSDQKALGEEWQGVAFEIRHQTLLAPMTHVSEVLAPPTLTSVPRVKHWVLGIANMHGNLIPVLDLQGLLYGKNISIPLQRQRVMVVNHSGISAGLLVDAVLGIKHFRVDERIEEIQALDSELQRFVTHAYRGAVEQYSVFELVSLIESKMFLDVAI